MDGGLPLIDIFPEGDPGPRSELASGTRVRSEYALPRIDEVAGYPPCDAQIHRKRIGHCLCERFGGNSRNLHEPRSLQRRANALKPSATVRLEALKTRSGFSQLGPPQATTLMSGQTHKKAVTARTAVCNLSASTSLPMTSLSGANYNITGSWPLQPSEHVASPRTVQKDAPVPSQVDASTGPEQTHPTESVVGHGVV